MATAKKLPSGSWRTLVYSHTQTINGKQKRIYESFTAETKKEAEFLAAEYKVKNNRKSVLDITVSEAIEKYISSKTKILSPSTVRGYKRYNANMLQDISSIKLKKLTTEDIQIAINNDAATHSSKTVKNAHGLLSAVLKEYHPDFILKTKLPQRVKYEISVPTKEIISTVLENCSSKDLQIAIVAAYSMGLRRSEICGLTWDNIDMKNRLVKITNAVVLDNNNGWEIKSPKSYSGKRTLPMPDVFFDEIQSIKEKSGPLISMTPTNISNNFRNLVNKLDIPHIRFHDLRHYYASVMLAVGIPDKYAMERMGHSTNTMLKNVYQHTFSDKQSEFTKHINDYFNT